MNTDKLYQYRTLIHCEIMDIPEHYKLYQHGTLINSAIVNTDTKCHYRTPLTLCNYGYIYKHYAVFDSNANWNTHKV